MPIVMVVEDERILRTILQSQLKSYADADILPALFRRAAEAVKWLDSGEAVDAAIVDLYLSPLQDGGFDVMEKLRAKLPSVPIIVLTTRNDRPALERTRTFEAARYLIVKQRWNESTLHECLRDCLSGKAKELKVIGVFEG